MGLNRHRLGEEERRSGPDSRGHTTGARAQFAQLDQVRSGQVPLIERKCDV